MWVRAFTSAAFPVDQLHLVEVDADHWKTWLHQRLEAAAYQPGRFDLLPEPAAGAFGLARHLTAERKTEEFIAGQGVVTRWERLRKDNHWLDALYNSCAAGYLAGARLIEEKSAVVRPRRSAATNPGMTRRDGSPWIDARRWQAGLRPPVSFLRQSQVADDQMKCRQPLRCFLLPGRQIAVTPTAFQCRAIDPRLASLRSWGAYSKSPRAVRMEKC